VRVIDTFRTVLSLAYSPCGRFLYSAGWQHVTRWDVFTGDEADVYRDDTATYLMNVVVSPTGGRIGWHDLARQRTTFGETTVRRTSRWANQPTRVALVGQPTHLFLADGTPVWHPDPVATDRGSAVVAFCHSGRLRLAPLPADVPSGRYTDIPELTRLLRGDDGQTLPVQPDRFGFASSGLFWWRQSQAFFLRELPTGDVREFHTLDQPPLAVTPDGRTGIAATGREVLLIDLPSGLTRERFNWDVGTVEAVTVAPDGLTAAVAGWAGGIAIFDLDG
jgi:hypothetical protein